MTKKTDGEFREMTEEQLGEYIKEQNNLVSNPKVKSADEVATEQKEEQAEEKPAGELGEVESEDNDPEFVRGKTRAEVIKMWSDSQSMISRQGNEKHELNKRLESLETQIQKLSIPQDKKDDFVDKLAGYNQDDITVIEQLVERKLEAKRTAEREADELSLKQSEADNEAFWDHLLVIDPVFAESVKEKVLKDIQVNRRETLQKQGWLKATIQQLRTSTNGKKPIETDLVEKKLKATTAGQGTVKFVSRKPITEMTADEYLEYARKQLNLPI